MWSNALRAVWELMLKSFAVVTLAGALCGCRTVGQIGNVQEPACRGAFSQAIGSILVAQGETREAADRLAVQALDELAPNGLGGHFTVESSSGAEYAFFVQSKNRHCLLRLYQRVRGSSVYLNNLNFIQTRELPSCTCSK